MKKILAFLFLISCYLFSSSQNVGIGTNAPVASAAMEIRDTSRGLLIPRMTMAQRTAIQNPAEGLMVYQTDSTMGFWYYLTNSWKKISSREYIAGNGIKINNDTIYATNNLDFNTSANKVRIGFNTSTNWQCPIGINQIVVELWGAGGSSSWDVSCGASCCYPGCLNTAFARIGGKGGYNKQLVTVTPGLIYNITIGQVGGGGTISGRVANGGVTTFNNGQIIAEGGIGGGINSCNGCYNVGGPNGIDGAVINFSHPSTQVVTPAFIPQSYITNTYPQCCASAATNGFAVISY